MRATEFTNRQQPILEGKHQVQLGDLVLHIYEDGQDVDVRVMDGDHQVGYVIFLRDGKLLIPDDLFIDQEYRGRGVAKKMYDYIKSLGFKIIRSGIQTNMGKRFWDKNRGEHVDVWEEGVAEGKIKLSTDPNWYGAEVDDTGFDSLPIVDIPTNRLVGFEPDSKMQEPKAKRNVKKILAGLKSDSDIPPILVRKYKGGYQVLDGHHRFWAYKVAKKDTIPARVIDPKDIEEVGKQGVAKGSINEGVNDPHIFKAIAMIGPMGAGKSTIARQLVGGSGLRSLNLDNFNELLIKQGKVVGGNLTPDQLERNWQLTQKQKGNWISERLGLLIDGSGRNIEGLVKPLNELEQLGYDTMIILVNVSLETSIQRQQSRAAQQAAQFGQGRNVPLDLAKSSYQQIQQNIPKLKQLYGNRLLIINNEGAVDLSQEKTIVNRFMAAPPSKPAAVAWIKAHSQSQGQKIDKQLAQQQRQQASAQRAQTQQGVAEAISWSSLDEGLSLEDKMAIFEEYAIRGNLTESIGQELGVTEAWSEKYKRSINCKNPKGFSQRAHCQGRKKKK